jgi:hypothetical protein
MNIKIENHRVAGIKFAWIFGLALAILSVIALFFLLRPYNLVSEGRVEVLPAPGEESVPGGVVTLRTLDFCNYGTATTIRRFLVNDIGGIELSPLFFNAPAEPVCFDQVETLIFIPREVPPGEWRIKVITSYRPNAIRSTIDLEKTSEPFTIFPEENKANAIPWE